MQCSAVQCSAVQCSAVQCSAVQCSAVQCRNIHWYIFKVVSLFLPVTIDCDLIDVTPYIQKINPIKRWGCTLPHFLAMMTSLFQKQASICTNPNYPGSMRWQHFLAPHIRLGNYCSAKVTPGRPYPRIGYRHGLALRLTMKYTTPSILF